MSDRLVKCPVCEEKLNKEQSVLYKSRYHHPECLEQRKAKEKERKTPAPKQMKSPEEETETEARKELIDYIDKLYGRHRLNPMLFKQIKQLREDGYTYEGMQLTLWYFHEVLGNSIRDDSGIGIIPYVYEKTKKWYVQMIEATERCEEIKESGQPITEEVFVDYVPRQIENYSDKRKLDIESI